jgi:hypothetical protein
MDRQQPVNPPPEQSSASTICSPAGVQAVLIGYDGRALMKERAATKIRFPKIVGLSFGVYCVSH